MGEENCTNNRDGCAEEEPTKQNMLKETCLDTGTKNNDVTSNQLLESDELNLLEEYGEKNHSEAPKDCSEECVLEQDESIQNIEDGSGNDVTATDVNVSQRSDTPGQGMWREENEPIVEDYVSVIDPERNIESVPILKSELNFTKEDMNEICREVFEGFSEVREDNSSESPWEPVSKGLRRKRKLKSRPSTSFSCSICDYSSRHRSALISHMMSHKQPSETIMYRCDFCDHETKRKGDLKAHMIIHKDDSEVKLFYCANCPYKTKRKCDLKQHVVVHQDKSLYKCSHCSYQTSNQVYFEKRHMLLHQEVEVIYKCDQCLYQTNIEHYLKSHRKRVHKNLDETEEYSCNWCDFKTKNKISIKEHMLIHTCPSDLKMFKCDMCPFQCKRKPSLRDHKLYIHMDTQQEYRCADCDYKSNRRSSIISHVRLHMDESKVKMYKCDKCGRSSRRKKSIFNHEKFCKKG